MTNLVKLGETLQLGDLLEVTYGPSMPTLYHVVVQLVEGGFYTKNVSSMMRGDPTGITVWYYTMDLFCTVKVVS